MDSSETSRSFAGQATLAGSRVTDALRLSAQDDGQWLGIQDFQDLCVIARKRQGMTQSDYQNLF